VKMTRGNQREIDRQRAANRHAGKGTAREGDPTKRREADANALAEKVSRCAEFIIYYYYFKIYFYLYSLPIHFPKPIAVSISQ
jgi:4F5 protein related disordered region